MEVLRRRIRYRRKSEIWWRVRIVRDRGSVMAVGGAARFGHSYHISAGFFSTRFGVRTLLGLGKGYVSKRIFLKNIK